MADLKQAFQPLLPPGRHVLSITELNSLTVLDFPKSVRRRMLFAELQKLVNFLGLANVVGEIWIDGSFLTEKLEPDDIDLSFAAWAHAFELLAPDSQTSIIQCLNGGKAFSPWLDTYLCFRFLPEDPRRAADKTVYWTEKWGVGWDGRLKGYIVLKLGETDVGLRLFA